MDKDSIIIGLIVVLIFVVVTHCPSKVREGMAAKGAAAQQKGAVRRPVYGPGVGHAPGRKNYQTTAEVAMPDFPGGIYNAYDVLNNQLDTMRGYHNDGYNQPPLWRQPHGLDIYHRSGADVKPDAIALAEREQWYSVDYLPDTHQEGFAAHYPKGEDALDYSTMITDLVVDPRTRENHLKWVEEMRPWSGTAMTVDDLDEAMEATTHFIGLRRPQAVVQYNPTQLTERDTTTFSGNNKFNFRG